MVFLDLVQHLHIHAEKTHKDFGAHYAGSQDGGWGWVNCESDRLPPYMHGWGKNLQFQQNSACTTEEKL